MKELGCVADQKQTLKAVEGQPPLAYWGLPARTRRRRGKMNIHNQTIDLGNGREITIETGKLAKQAHGSVVVRSGDTMLLATIVSSYEPMDVDFLL